MKKLAVGIGKVTLLSREIIILEDSVRLSFQCLALFLKSQQNAPSFQQSVLLSTLPKYLQLDLIIASIINCVVFVTLKRYLKC